MNDSQDLAQAMKTALDESGDLIRLRAQLAEEILETCNQQNQSNAGDAIRMPSLKRCKPAMPPEIILANNLIRQYLEYAGLHNTSSVLCTESGLPEKLVPDSVLKSKFPSMSSTDGKPLLCTIVKNAIQTKKLHQLLE